MTLSTAQVVAIAAAVVVVVVILAVLISARSRSRRLQSKFGPEYGRAVEESGGSRAAEAELQAREKRVLQYHLKALRPDEKERFRADWKRVQANFVDDPSEATARADDLLGKVMSARGYPDGDFQHRLEDLSVNHAFAVQNYRAACDAVSRRQRGDASTEDMRRAIVQYRTLFEELLGENTDLRAAS
jgi:hypothetical protein